MGQFDHGEYSSPARASQFDAHTFALDGASVLFEQKPLVRAAQSQGNAFPLLMNPQFGERAKVGVQASPQSGHMFQPGEIGNPDAGYRQTTVQNYPGVKDRLPAPAGNLPRLPYHPPSPSEPMVYGSQPVKQTDLNSPYVSETSERANSMFESMARIGSAAYFIHRDQAQRTAALELQLANTKLVTPATVQNFQVARDGLLTSLKNPIQSAEVAMEAMAKNYPSEIFNTSGIPKVNGSGKIMVPNHWELGKLAAADRVAAERYMSLINLRDTLTVNWPPTQGPKLLSLPTNLQSMPFIQAEKLGAQAARFDAAGSAFTDEATKVLKSFESTKMANSNLVFKNIGTLAGAWVANTAVDLVIDTKHGPSMVTWTADLASPAILLTRYGLGTKFAVVTGAHVIAKLYDKYTEKP
ncbi:MAG: hypothetical protein C0507_06345 [Cyanobacteria bacterium PR.3.49]|nr:hypothetical protein [Cyanobacteria bacterium PR.3.49]